MAAGGDQPQKGPENNSIGENVDAGADATTVSDRAKRIDSTLSRTSKFFEKPERAAQIVLVVVFLLGALGSFGPLDFDPATDDPTAGLTITVIAVVLLLVVGLPNWLAVVTALLVIAALILPRDTLNMVLRLGPGFLRSEGSSVTLADLQNNAASSVERESALDGLAEVTMFGMSDEQRRKTDRAVRRALRGYLAHTVVSAEAAGELLIISGLLDSPPASNQTAEELRQQNVQEMFNSYRTFDEFREQMRLLRNLELITYSGDDFGAAATTALGQDVAQYLVEERSSGVVQVGSLLPVPTAAFQDLEGLSDGQTIDGRIAVRDSIHWYRLELEQDLPNSALSIDVEVLPGQRAEFDPVVFLYRYDDAGEHKLIDYDDDSGEYLNAKLVPKAPLEADRYLVAVADAIGESGQYLVSLSVGINGAVRPDFDLLSLDQSKFGQSDTLFIDEGESAGWVELNISQRGNFAIEARGLSVSDPSIKVYDANDLANWFAWDDDSGGNLNARLNVTLEEGNYYVAVEDVNRWGGEVEFIVTEQGAVPDKVNLLLDQAVSLPVPSNASASFGFRAEDLGIYRIEVDGGSIEGGVQVDPYLTLYDDTYGGEIVAENDDVLFGDPSSVIEAVLIAGSYTGEVMSVNGSAGDVTVTVYAEEAQRLAAGQPLDVAFDARNTMKSFVFTPDEAGFYAFRAIGGFDPDPYILLSDLYGFEYLNDEDSAGDYNPLVIDHLGAGDERLVFVYAWEGQTQVEVEHLGMPHDGVPLQIGTVMNSQMQQIGDQGWFAFDLADPSDVYLDIRSRDNLTLSAATYRIDGDWVDRIGLLSGSSDVVAGGAFLDPGRYLVIVTEDFGDTGSFTIEVSEASFK